MRLVLDSSLTRLAYRCHPDGCPRGRTCCMGLVVEVSRPEVRAMDTLMDELARLVPSLREGGAYASVFVDDPPGYVIEARDDGGCPFLFRTRSHALCAIHHLALESGRSVAAYKPTACRHWPITLAAEGDRVRVLVEPAARRMGCVDRVGELPGKPTVLEAFRDEIAALERHVLAAPPTGRSDRARRRRRSRGCLLPTGGHG
jgi:hypothetical protein